MVKVNILMYAKMVVLVVVLLLGSSLVAAVAQMEVSEVRVYLNDARVRDVDKNGGTIEDVHASDLLEFRVTVKNLDGDNQLTDILIFGSLQEIDDGNDVEEELSEFDLRKSEDDTRSLIFEIPADVKEDDFDLDLKIRGINKNSTEEYYNTSFTVEIQDTNQKPISFTDAINNITNLCKQKDYDIAQLKGSIIIASDGCKETGQIEEIRKQISESQTKISSLQTEKDLVQKDFETVRDDLNSCQTDKAKKETDLAVLTAQGGKKNNYFGWAVLAVVCVGGWILYKKSKGVGGPIGGTRGGSGLPMNLGRGGSNVG